jgi:hypothetical protein
MGAGMCARKETGGGGGLGEGRGGMAVQSVLYVCTRYVSSAARASCGTWV